MERSTGAPVADTHLISTNDPDGLNNAGPVDLGGVILIPCIEL